MRSAPLLYEKREKQKSMIITTTDWWCPFINQLARLAVDNNIDGRTEEGFEMTLVLLVECGKLN